MIGSQASWKWAAAALALSVATASHGQGTPAGASSAAEVAASPAAKRLGQLIDAINSGEPATVRAYLQANGVDSLRPQPGPPGSLPLVGSALDIHRRSTGFDLVRIEKADKSGGTATVRNRLTGEEQALAIKIEEEAPNRITAVSTPLAGSGDPKRSRPAGMSEKQQFAEIAAHLDKLGQADVFSGVVVIARDGKAVFSQAHGYADRERRIANTVETPFLLASMNKLFTGLAIGQLVERGVISYDDPLSKFVPDFPDAENAKQIKIKHLLSHTGGLGSYWGPKFNEARDRLRTVQSVLDIADRNPPAFEPGTNWQYSNTGYQLLGRVIEVATGETYFDYMRKNVFAPAGVSRDLFPEYDRLATGVALPYEVEFDGTRVALANKMSTSPRRGTPAGGGLASATDLLKLSQAVESGRVVKPETLRLHSSAKPEIGSPMYGYGITPMARLAKRPLVGHGGNSMGQCTEFGWLADTPYTIIVLSNATMGTCMEVVAKLLRVLGPTKPATS